MAHYNNTLTGLIPDLYENLDIVSRELTGFIPSVNQNFAASRAAIDEVVRVPMTQGGDLVDVAPAMTTPEPTNRTVDYVDVKITKSKAFEFGLTGEEMKALDNGIGSGVITTGWFSQGVRKLVNEIEADLALEAALSASRGYGTPATPFGTNFAELAQVRKILDDNGAPGSDRSFIMDTTAGAALRTLGNITKVNEAGSTMGLRDGELLNVHGFSLKESAQVVRPAIGTGAATGVTTGVLTAVGATSIAVKASGSGTILAGDYVTFAGDTNKYLVVTGIAALGSGGTLVIADPGLRVAIPAAETTITVVARSSRNIAFHRDAIQLVTRAPALPNGRDAAIDSMMITDARSGLTFEIRIYEGYRKMRGEIALAWGVKAIKPEHIAAQLGA